MKWHEGNVASAIQEVKKNNVCLFVFVTDEENKSGDYEKGLENDEELNLLVNKMICLKIKNDSEEFKQFSDFYPVLQVPSIHVISPSGNRLKCLTGDFGDMKILEELKACADSLNVVGDSSTLASSEPSLEERQAILQAKLLEKRKQRAEEEKEKELLREKERREMGKEMNKFKVSKKEQEENDIKEEIRKRRQEEKEARENVLRRIEEDKRERKMRRLEQTVEQDHTQNMESQDQEVRERHQNLSSPDGYCRIQFRFPDGHSTNSQFQKDVNFIEVRQFVKNHIGEKYGDPGIKFELKQFFPRRSFEVEDDQKSLESLQLIPTACLAVVFPLKSMDSSKSINNMTPWLMWPINIILGIINSVFTWLQSAWTGLPTSIGQSGNTGSSSQPNQNKDSENKANMWEARQKRLLAADGRTIKKDGKMATFSDASRNNESGKDGKDDDDAWWNGNSTQQM